MWGLALGGIQHTYRIHTRHGLTEIKWAFNPNNGQNRRISAEGTAIALRRSPKTARRWLESWQQCPHVAAVAFIKTLCLQPDSDRPAERSRLAAGFTVEEGVVA